MQPETKFKIKFREELELIPNSYFEKIQQKSLRGTPDFLGVVNSWAIALELKVDSPLESLQEYKLNKWKKAGAYSAVVTPKNYKEILADLIIIANKKPLE